MYQRKQKTATQNLINILANHMNQQVRIIVLSMHLQTKILHIVLVQCLSVIKSIVFYHIKKLLSNQCSENLQRIN